MSVPLATLPLPELAEGIRERRFTPTALVEDVAEALAAVEAGPEPLNLFVSFDLERAFARALEVEADLSAGKPLPPLAGIPAAVKDNLCTVDFPTTCGSRVLAGYTSPYEATAVLRLREAGAIVLGKTNLDEFAMGSSTEHSAYGPTRNPWDRSRVAGGSSGGSAAAVAAGVVPLALGSDTGGSVRQPAAFCGVVGIRPTWGRVSRYGLVAFASSLDQVGTFGRTVYESAYLLQTVAGRDPLDATSADLPVPNAAVNLGEGLEGTTIGVPGEYFPDGMDPRVRTLCRAAIRRLEELGAEVREVSLPHTAYAVPAYAVLAVAEASSNLARFDGVRFGAPAPGAGSVAEVWERTRALFGAEAKRRILLGTYVLSAGHRDEHHARAARVRALVALDFRWVFDSGVDAVFTPTTPTPAFRLGEVTDPYEVYRSDAFTVGPALAGLPALSLPLGLADGLPVGGQLVGRAWGEPEIVRVAHALEASLAAAPLAAPPAPAAG
ncbi:MAG TPA: Asp-tRNA(Asn)/Glu-tRNA(Gln) amidotransferase subunit GatA [Longimicrobiaceae bacterium]|nr:Asp-tRNA(Asn)/Glu-tRNA(Gln) amidotransferase subunit GatA [Longimicrobiaceae bacterium]